MQCNLALKGTCTVNENKTPQHFSLFKSDYVNLTKQRLTVNKLHHIGIKMYTFKYTWRHIFTAMSRNLPNWFSEIH